MHLMHLIGIPLRRPSHNELVASTVMAIGLWLAGIGLMHSAQLAPGRVEAGALLVVCLWGCVSARLGIRIERGGRHLLASVAGSAVLLGGYELLGTLLA